MEYKNNVVRSIVPCIAFGRICFIHNYVGRNKRYKRTNAQHPVAHIMINGPQTERITLHKSNSKHPFTKLFS